MATIGGLSHIFFPKSMMIPYLRNALSNQQKYSILANDLVRRLSNINKNIVSKKRDHKGDRTDHTDSSY